MFYDQLGFESLDEPVSSITYPLPIPLHFLLFHNVQATEIVVNQIIALPIYVIFAISYLRAVTGSIYEAKQSKFDLVL